MENEETLKTEFIRRMSNYYLPTILKGALSENDLEGLEKILFNRKSFLNDDYCKALKKEVLTAIRHCRYARKLFAKKYKCKENEISFYGKTFIKNDEQNIYKVALGSVDYSFSSAISTNQLRIVKGRLILNSSRVEKLSNLKEVMSESPEVMKEYKGQVKNEKTADLLLAVGVPVMVAGGGLTAVFNAVINDDPLTKYFIKEAIDDFNIEIE